MFENGVSLGSRFIFPEINEEISLPKSINSLKNQMKKQYDEQFSQTLNLELFPFVFSRMIIHGKIHFRAKCRYCNSVLNWVGNNQYTLQLTKNKVSHIHPGTQVKRGRNKKVFQYLNALDKDFDRKRVIKQIMSKFALDLQYTRLLMRQWRLGWEKTIKQQKSAKALSQKLNEDGIDFLYQPSNAKGVPDVTVIVTKNMKELYQKFGYVVKIDFISKKIHEEVEAIQTNFENFQQIYKDLSFQNQMKDIQNTQKQITKKKYALGLLTGFNSLNESIIYGIAFIKQENKQNVLKVFELFFKTMQSKCGYIISDKQKCIEDAITHINRNQPQEQIVHLFDQSEIIDELKTNKPKYWKQIIKLIRSKSRIQYLDRMQQLNISSTKDFIQKFDLLSHKFIIPMIESEMFLGVNCSLTSCKELNIFVKSRVAQINSFWDLIPKIISECVKINHEASLRLRISKDPFFTSSVKGIKSVQQFLPKEVFETLADCLTLSYKIVIMNQTEDMIKVRQNYQILTLQKGQNGKWKCQCDYQQKTNLPCVHQLKIIDDVEPYIGDFWAQNKQLQTPRTLNPTYRKITKRKKQNKQTAK